MRCTQRCSIFAMKISFLLPCLFLSFLILNASGEIGSSSLGPPPLVSSPYGPPEVTGHIESPDIKESSGLSASECQDVLWTHNDAGNEPLIFAMDYQGRHLGVWRLTGAQNVDWESISTYKDASGRCSLIVGDIGDNDERRTTVTIYKISEPEVTANSRNADIRRPLSTAVISRLEVGYPNGPQNAEIILTRPSDGAIYILTKEKKGRAEIYRVEPNWRATGKTMAKHVGEVSMPNTPPGLLTGGSLSPDGRRLMLCDVKQGYEMTLPAGVEDFDAIWRQPISVVDLGTRKQGEGVSYGRDGRSVFASSEKPNTPIIRIQRISEK